MPSPRISILLPSYNHARFLPACLDSIRAQTITDWDVILVDDVSQDDSVEIARSYAAKDPRVQVFTNEKNLGTYGTLQRALELSHGALVAVMNSDDLWMTEKLRMQVELLERHPEMGFCYTLGHLISDAGEVDEREDVHADWPKEEVQNLLPWLVRENRILASSVLFRRPGLRFEPTLRYSGDWAALLEQSSAANAVCVPERLTFWRQHRANTYTQSPAQMLEEIRIRRAIDSMRTSNERVREGLGWNAMNLVALHAFFNDSQGVFRYGLRALGLLPDKRLALRRFLSVLVPARKRRLHFWPEAETVLPSSETGAWRKRICELPGLELPLDPKSG